MKIGVAATVLNTEHVRGMGRYAYELMRHSTGHPGVQWRAYGDNPAQPLHLPAGVPVQGEVFTCRGDRFRAWEQLGLPLRLRRANIDLLHCPDGVLPLWQPKPTVVTLHDTMAWDDREDGRISEIYWERVIPAALHKSAAIITGSLCARDDISAKWPALAQKLHVIPHGIDEAFLARADSPLPASLAARLQGKPFLLYLGGPLPRKRFGWAMEVLAACRDPQLQLVACGFNRATRGAAQDSIPPALKERVHIAEFVTDAEMRALYRQAGAMLYPTLYEGFGFPAVEAQASGTPTIFSALGSLKELIGPLTLAVPANDIAAWVQAVQQAIAMPPAERAQRAADTAAWVRREFVWPVSLARHLDIFRSVLERT